MRRSGLRELIVRQLTTLPEGGPPAAIDLQMRAPLTARRVAKSSMHPLRRSISLWRSTTVCWPAAGTMRPSSAFAGIDYVKEDGTAVPLDANSYKFPAWAQGKDDKSKTDVTGFVAWIPLDEPPGRCCNRDFRCALPQARSGR